jgi:thioredoxin-related protein
MKKLAALCLLFFPAFSPAQVKVAFMDAPLAEVLAKAKTEHKPVFLMGYATWCAHCNKVKADVLTQEKVGEFFNANFVCAWQDMEAADGIALRGTYAIKAFPAFLFLDADGTLLYSAAGEFTADKLIVEGRNALDQKKQLPYLEATFERDTSNADNCLAYVMALRRSNLDTQTPASRYLATQSEDQLISAINWKIIANGIRLIPSREFQFVLKNQDRFAAVSSPKRVEKKIVNIVQETLKPAVEAGDMDNYLKYRAQAAAIGLSKTDSLVYKSDLAIYEKAKDWKSYRDVTRTGTPKFSWQDARELREIARNYMANLTGTEAMRDAAAWAERSLELSDSYETRIIISWLYLKAGDAQKARQEAQTARAVATANGWDPNQADAILNQLK